MGFFGSIKNDVEMGSFKPLFITLPKILIEKKFVLLD